MTWVWQCRLNSNHNDHTIHAALSSPVQSGSTRQYGIDLFRTCACLNLSYSNDHSQATGVGSCACHHSIWVSTRICVINVLDYLFIGHRYLFVVSKVRFPLKYRWWNHELLTLDCNRLFPSRDRLMFHRKRDHDSEEDSDIITWNEWFTLHFEHTACASTAVVLCDQYPDWMSHFELCTVYAYRQNSSNGTHLVYISTAMQSVGIRFSPDLVSMFSLIFCRQIHTLLVRDELLAVHQTECLNCARWRYYPWFSLYAWEPWFFIFSTLFSFVDASCCGWTD